MLLVATLFWKEGTSIQNRKIVLRISIESSQFMLTLEQGTPSPDTALVTGPIYHRLALGEDMVVIGLHHQLRLLSNYGLK